LCILERICLSWIKDRIGCNDEVYALIDRYEKIIKHIDFKIEKLQKEINNSQTLEKREKMKALRE
jgi:hypothetical protein